ncbi:hypothetical protein Syun_022329 [Stephania yunnanensis]|uniref:ARC6 IMS domain-containing protein n=1 Tax=Stephania yunnanensis TaxID=152371 RepID=A0AAP0HYF8_9MAGN
MALAPLTPSTISPCSCACILEDHRNPTSRHAFPLSGDASRVRIGASLLGFRSRRKGFVVSVEARGRSRSSVKEFQTASVDNGGQIRSGVEVPVTCYQIIGVSDKAEKDEIVKSVMDLKGAEVEEGYTMDVVLSRQDLLMDVRDKLLFEQEYAGNPREKVPPKASLRMPWSWLPGALCLLQEVGAEKLVLEFGRAALQHPEVKPYVHDILLSMALAEVRQAIMVLLILNILTFFIYFIHLCKHSSHKISLGKLPLLSQIEETLEELAPACTLELLGMPHAPENAERRRGAIAALHELLRQGLDVEASSQVQDWPCFLIQALNKLMASEIVDLVPWENLADTRRNKKSLESHNQRVVIDFACFRIAMAAHIALGFSSKQTDLVRSRSCLYSLVQSSCTECLKLEDAFCSFLLGQGSEAAVADILRRIEINSGHASLDGRLGPYHLGPAEIEQEIWLKDAVLGLFPDTRNCSPKLANFFIGEKRILRATRHTKETSRSPTLNHRPSAVLPPECASSDERVLHLSSPRHFGTAVKQLAPSSLQSPLTAVKASNVSSGAASSVQLKRNFGINQKKAWESVLAPGAMVARITLVTVVGCFVFISFKLFTWKFRKQTQTSTLLGVESPLLLKQSGPASIGGSNIVKNLVRILTMSKKLKHSPEEGTTHSLLPIDDLLLFTKALDKRQMPMEEAESLVRQWQTIKAEALGPDHEVQSLSEVLVDPMLTQWQTLADSAKDKLCYWRFVLLQLSVLRAEIVEDGLGGEMAEIEAFLEEAAELVDESLPKNPNYYSTYKIRYILKRRRDGSWRFCGWNVQTPK